MRNQFIPLPISHTTEYGFSFIESLPLDDRFCYTPMWHDAPLAPVTLSVMGRELRWKVVRCPYCAQVHTHGATDGGYIEPKEDPRLFLGGRVSHCHPGWVSIPEDTRGDNEYRLIAIDGEPTPDGLDLYFPMWWKSGRQVHQRISISPESKSAVWNKSDGHCWYCGDALNPFLTFEVDHLLSLKNGGSNEIDNLVPACRSCNAQKSHWHVEIFRIRHFTGRYFWFEKNGKGGVGS